MPTHFGVFDWLLLVVYFAATIGVGAYFYLRGHSVEGFTAANRSLPGWALGLSMFGSYVSSLSFLANPGSSYAGNWNAFVFSLATPLAAAIAVWWLVPFYRRTGEVSAYEHLEYRFGAWARTYAVVSFLLLQVARMGAVVYLLSIVMAPITGVKIHAIIIVTGTVMTCYTFMGGIGAVVWTGVLQSVVLVTGVLICVLAVIYRAPGGLGSMVNDAYTQGKFGLGPFDSSLAAQTFWVVFAYGVVINISNFAVDQSYVQRYITARSDRDAAKSVWLTAALYVPVAGIFFFIGTGLFAFYGANPDSLPSGTFGDKVFPYFIATQLPVGLAGIVVAAIFAASMDSNLGSMATLTYVDLYKRYLRPQAGEREGLLVLRLATLFWGVACVGIGLAMIRAQSILDVWWQIAGILSGGVLGLFLLGLLCPKAKSAAGAVGVVVGLVVISWMTASPILGGRLTTEAMQSQSSPRVLTLAAETGRQLSAGEVIHLKYSAIDDERTRGPRTVGETREVVAVGGEGREIELDREPSATPSGQVTIYDDSIWYRWRNPLHPYMTVVVGTLTVLLTGYLVALAGSARR
jgi:SSS family solute:Na+ symporter